MEGALHLSGDARAVICPPAQLGMATAMAMTIRSMAIARSLFALNNNTIKPKDKTAATAASNGHQP
jgi:hypothetical protein